MYDLVVDGVVGDLNRHRLAFFEAQQRAGDLPIVGDGLDGAVWRDFECVGSDVDAVVRLRQGVGSHRQNRSNSSRACETKKFSPGDHGASMLAGGLR